MDHPIGQSDNELMTRRRDDDVGEQAGPGGGDPWSAALGGFIRAQRRLANLSLREMANLTSVSNAYLSQVERGLHQPSLKVLRSIADALNLSTEQMLAQTGWLRRENGQRPETGQGSTGSPEDPTVDTEDAIRRDPRLSPAQRETLLEVYRGFVEGSTSR